MLGSRPAGYSASRGEVASAYGSAAAAAYCDILYKMPASAGDTSGGGPPPFIDMVAMPFIDISPCDMLANAPDDTPEILFCPNAAGSRIAPCCAAAPPAVARMIGAPAGVGDRKAGDICAAPRGPGAKIRGPSANGKNLVKNLFDYLWMGIYKN